MGKPSRKRIGYERPGIGLRVLGFAAIRLVVSAIAICATLRVLSNKRPHPPASVPARITMRARALDEQSRPQNGHETRDINVRAVTWAAIGLVVSAIAIYGTMGGLFNLFKSQYPSPIAPSRITAPGTIPSQPRLQVNPAYDLQQLREVENAKLNSYGWIDKNAGIVRIPIDHAIDLLARRGLPARGTSSDSGGKTPLQMRQEKAEASHP